MNCTEETEDFFVSHFSSVYSSARSITDTKSLNILLFDLPNNAYFSIDDVLLKLYSLRGEHAIGPDGIPGDYLCQVRQVITFLIWLLIWWSLDKDVFPKIWKISHITPIFKSGFASNWYWTVLCPLQSQFLLNSNMVSVRPFNWNLQRYLQIHLRYLKCGSQVYVIYIDFAKAFDSVNHETLISVLPALGFGYPLLECIWCTSSAHLVHIY